MSNVMSLKSFKNSVKRNGFDLSFKNAFTAKAGELLPVFCKEVIPGDKWKIKGQAYMRTQPVMSAAYVRMREYYDFFFVPYKLLWNRAPTFFTNLPDYHQAEDINKPVQVGDQHPYFTVLDMVSVIRNMINDSLVNYFGYDRSLLATKLLYYLDYCGINGPYESIETDTLLNPMPLLAYQKVCQDFFRDDQWEQAAPWRYNLDYITSSSNPHIPTNSINFDNLTMFDLNYCNYPKDYFMGMLPSPQYGDEVFAPLGGTLIMQDPHANVPNGLPVDNASNVLGLQLTNSNYKQLVSRTSENFDESGYVQMLYGTGLGDGISILALRQAEAMQKWREIAQSGRQDYQTQMEKHFGVSPSDAMSNHCKYLGGWTSNVDINEVVNNNFAVSDEKLSQADIKGKGSASSVGNVDFESKEHGLIIGIYHCLPLLDYRLTGVSKLNLKSHFTDYAIPEFDSVGMEKLNGLELVGSTLPDSSGEEAVYDVELGFVPRYADYKTSLDRVHGEFGGTLQYWVASLTPEYLREYFDRMKETYGSYKIDFSFFKVNPCILDNLFGAAADSNMNTDQFLVNAFFDTKVVRNLDYNGLPY